MSRWLIKSALQRAISWLPGSQQWNEWLQVHVTKSLGLTPSAFEAKLQVCRQYLDDFSQLRPDATAFTALELGTGWYPIVPLALYLCGASEVWSYDIAPLLRTERLKLLLELFCDYDRNGRLPSFLPQLQPARMQRVHEALREIATESPAKILERLNIHILVQDAQQTGLPPHSVDLFFSYSVLEYIPAPILANLFAEFKRVARPRAVMIHHIAMFDQFARFDHSISQLNYLKFSDAQWRWLRSPLLPLTRLRIPQYRQLVAASGFQIRREATTTVPPKTLDNLKLAAKFQQFSREDLLVITAWQVSQLP